MLDFNNAMIPTENAANPEIEPAKVILENTDAILKALSGELARIEEAIFSPKPCKETKEPADECLLGTLNRQRNVAEELLRTAVHIREGLW